MPVADVKRATLTRLLDEHAEVAQKRDTLSALLGALGVASTPCWRPYLVGVVHEANGL